MEGFKPGLEDPLWWCHLNLSVFCDHVFLCYLVLTCSVCAGQLNTDIELGWPKWGG